MIERVATTFTSLAIRSMGTDNYPGRELSLSQLIFALNNELKRAAYSPSCVTKIILYPPQNDALTPFIGTAWTRFPNSTETLQTRCQLSASGGTLWSTSTGFHWMSFPSSLPISLPKRIDFTHLSCAAIGVEHSFDTAHSGLNCPSKTARPT